jgi:hypothetical protein
MAHTLVFVTSLLIDNNCQEKEHSSPIKSEQAGWPIKPIEMPGS